MDRNRKSSKSNDELRGLIGALCDGTLSESEERRLVELLESGDQAQQLFIEMMNLEVSLQYSPEVEALITPGIQAQVPDDLPLNEPSLRLASAMSGLAEMRPVLVASAAMLACLVLALGWWLGDLTAKHRHTANLAMEDTVPRNGSFAIESELNRPLLGGPVGVAPQVAPLESGLQICGRIVRQSPGCEWSSKDIAIMQGTYLRPGQSLSLVKGNAQVDFSSGGTIILQGPAVFSVNSTNGGFLQEGKLTAISDPGSKGLTLRTPNSWFRLIDGQFGTTVEKSGMTDLQVISGSITAGLVDRGGAVVRTCSLAKGSAVRFNASTELVSRITFSADDYVWEVPESFVAYQNLAGIEGNQTEFSGSLGMDFVVKDPIVVTKLGVFDSKADGLKRTITAQLWMRDEAGTPYHFYDDFGIEKLSELQFTPDDPGKLVDSDRLKSLDRPLVLAPGAYTIVAYGYGEEEPNGNEGNIHFDVEGGRNFPIFAEPLRLQRGSDIPTDALKRLGDGGGTILFVGTSRFDPETGNFPRLLDSGTVNRYRAGTFEYQRIRWDQIDETGRWLKPLNSSDSQSMKDRSI